MVEIKSDPIARERSGFLAGRSTRTSWNTRKGMKEVYNHAILFMCMDKLSSSAASINWEVYKEKDGSHEVVKNHLITRLLQEPSPQVDGSALIYHIIGSLITCGDAYILSVRNTQGKVTELWNVDAGDITIRFRQDGTIGAYVYKDGDSKNEKIFDLDDDGYSPEIMRFSRNSIESGSYLGKSLLEPVTKHANLYDSLVNRTYDKAENSINDSGFLSINDRENAEELSAEQFEQIKSQLGSFRAGGKRSGDMAIMQNVDIVFTKLTQDMSAENEEAMHAASRVICSVFGIPPMILGIPGDNTYSNYKEANLSFWKNTVIPYYLIPLGRTLSRWLFNDEDNYFLRADLDSIPALADERMETQKCIATFDHLTINEKRAELGYPPIEGGDVLFVPLSNVPLGAEIEDDIDEDNKMGAELRLIKNEN